MRDSWVVNSIMAEYYRRKNYERKMQRENCKDKKCSDCLSFDKCYGNGSDNYEGSNRQFRL